MKLRIKKEKHGRMEDYQGESGTNNEREPLNTSW